MFSPLYNKKYFYTLGSKLKNPATGAKKYHSVLKKLMGTSKFSNIPPILDNDTFITDPTDKATLFNTFFAKQCTVVPTSSTLPTDGATPPFSINTINISEEKILDLIQGLNANKSHGCDNISIKMIKICDTSLVKPLYIICKNCLSKGIYPLEWKKGNILPIHKKDKKHLVKNYRPILLLLIFGKIFEKIIFDDLYSHFFGNKLISDKQSGFRKGDSTVKQLLTICHEINLAFDSNPTLEIRAVFLDISKAFDKVWHEGLLFKLKRYGVNGKVLELVTSFLSHRLQRVTLEGVHSSWTAIKAGVPQGSVLGPFFFLVYINDLLEGIQSDGKIFADDTSLFYKPIDNLTSTRIINQDLATINLWAYQWKMIFNPDMSKQAVEVVFSRKNIPNIYDELVFNDIPVKKVDETKHLGLILDSKLYFQSHLNEKLKLDRKGIGVIKRLFPYVSRKTLEDIYKLYIRPHLDYADVIFHIPNTALAVSGA